MYYNLRKYPNRLRQYHTKRSALQQAINYVDELVTPQNDSILIEFNNQLDALVANIGDDEKAALADLCNIFAFGEELLHLRDGSELKCVMRVYPDAVAVIEDYQRTVFWNKSGILKFTDFSVNVELWLESGKLMSDYNDVPF